MHADCSYLNRAFENMEKLFQALTSCRKEKLITSSKGYAQPWSREIFFVFHKQVIDFIKKQQQQTWWETTSSKKTDAGWTLDKLWPLNDDIRLTQ